MTATALSGRKYRVYPEHKVSGVEWLVDIPNHWYSTKIKYGYEITLGKMLQKAPKNDNNLLKPYLKAINIQPKGISAGKVDKMWFSPNEIKSLKLQKNDVLISEGGDVGRSAIWNNELVECYIQNAINRARALKENNPKLLLYWMALLKESDYINVICNKATIAHYTAEKLEASPLFLPPAKEQQKIANFLDHETARIDTLIESQEKLIELLKEKRQAVISHAVTRGIPNKEQPNVPMKDSGVEWLGEVPAHWSVTRAKFISRIFIPQRNKPVLNETNDGISWATMDDMKSEYIKRTRLSVSDKAFKVAGSKILPKNSVIASCVGNFGIASISKIDLIINQQLQAFIPVNINSEYLKEIIYISKCYFELIGTAATLVYVNQQGFENLPVLLPSQEEQFGISKYIEQQRDKFELLINKCEEQIDLIKERKTALISAAVTGKIDVRDWNINNDQ